MKNDDGKYRLKKSQVRFLTQLKEYVETNSIFNNKDKFDILSYEGVPELNVSNHRMAARYVFRPDKFLEDLEEILKSGEYNEEEKQSLGIVRDVVFRQDYPFKEFKYDPRKEIK